MNQSNECFDRSDSRILVVDDEDMVRKILCEHLESRGYDVHSAKDGVECLQKVEDVRPDAILLDLKMPRMDGISVLRKLRAMKLDTPVIVLSACCDLKSEVEINELWIGQFMEKPFSPKIVEYMLETALTEARDATKTPASSEQ